MVNAALGTGAGPASGGALEDGLGSLDAGHGASLKRKRAAGAAGRSFLPWRAASDGYGGRFPTWGSTGAPKRPTLPGDNSPAMNLRIPAETERGYFTGQRLDSVSAPLPAPPHGIGWAASTTAEGWKKLQAFFIGGPAIYSSPSQTGGRRPQSPDSVPHNSDGYCDAQPTFRHFRPVSKQKTALSGTEGGVRAREDPLSGEIRA